MKPTYSKRLKDLREMIKIQGDNGNWNFDPYMHGMYNGMEFALSLMENREPEFREAPKRWLYKHTLKQKISLWWLRFTRKDVVRYSGGTNIKL